MVRVEIKKPAIFTRTTLLRAAWLLSAISVVSIVLLATPHRYEMLQTDYYGFDTGAPTLGWSPSFLALYFTALELVAAFMSIGVAGLIAWKRADDWFAILVAVSLTLYGLLSGFPDGLSLADSRWTIPIAMLRFIEMNSLMAVFCLFPNGHFAPKWFRLLFVAWLFFSLFIALNYPIVGGDAIVLPNSRTNRDAVWHLSGIGGFLVALGGQFIRYRQYANPTEKQQMKWVMFGFLLPVILTIPLVTLMFAYPAIYRSSDTQTRFTVIVGTLYILSSLAIPITLTLSIIRYRLWDIGILLNRTVVYGVLMTFVVTLYALIVSGAGLLLQSENNFVASLLATGIIAVLFQPARTRLQTMVNRQLFGDRDDPAGVLARLTSQLEAGTSDNSLFSTLTTTIAVSLKLPYVALWLSNEDGDFDIAAQTGRKPQQVETLPLMHQREIIGQLVVAPRSPSETLSAADDQLLSAIARLTATTVYTVRLTDQVQEARVRTVSAREEERRRLRRDLHDGLGPVLASQGLKLAAARQLLREKPDFAEELLDEVMNQSENTVAEVRRLIYALRPPTLDEFGLVSAIREHVETIEVGTQLQITLNAPNVLPPIPAAIEVAAFRIVQEALNNILQHAQARSCTILIQINGALHIYIQDDGVGLSASSKIGVGLRSMRERATEVGGNCDVMNGEHGVNVRLELPLEYGGA